MAAGHGAPGGGQGQASRRAEETRVFREALSRLRAERDPAGALELLDRYDRDYPGGSYAAEAAVARVDALLAAGRRADALSVLRKLPLATLPRGPELLVTRGELAAAAGDCAAATVDFDRALAGGVGPALEARVAAGRAACGR